MLTGGSPLATFHHPTGDEDGKGERSMVIKPRPHRSDQVLWFIIGFVAVIWLTRLDAHWFQFTHGMTLLVSLVIVALSEAWPIELGRGHVSLSAAGFVSAFLVGGLTAAFWVLLIGTLVGWLKRGFRGILTVANLALLVLTLGVASSVFHLWNGSALIGIPLFALTFLVVNHLWVDFYYWLRDGTLSRQDIMRSVEWDGLGWALSLPLVAIYVLLLKAYNAWWVGLLGLFAYGAVTFLLTFYYQTRIAHEATRRTARASEAIAAANDQVELLTRVKDAFADVVGFTSFVAYLKHPITGILERSITVHPDATLPYPDEFIPDEKGLTSWALATHTAEFIVDSRQSRSARPSPTDSHPVVSGFILPLVADRKICGVIVVGHDYAYGYSRYDFEMVQVLADHTAMAYGKWMIQEEAVHLSRVDSLLPTVYNYRFFREVADERIRQSSSRGLALAFLDMDNFKTVNDRYGHFTGDEVLRRFSHLVHAELRERDVLARYGGDEFVVLFDNVDEAGVLAALDRIQERLSHERWMDLDVVLGVSCGYALYPNDGKTPETLLNRADLRMYANKVQRKANIQIVPSR